MTDTDYKNTTTGLDAQLALIRGMQLLARLVGTTLGPQGRHVVLQHRAGLAPRMSKDGVEVARYLSLPDPEAELGVRLLRDAAITVSNTVGDGTTTATVFAADLATRALKLVSMGADALEVRLGMALAAYSAQIAISNMARSADVQTLKAVVSTAANGDSNVASRLVEAYEKVGEDGTIEIEVGDSVEDVLEVAAECVFETIPLVGGLMPPTGALRLKEPLIVFVDGEIEGVDDILAALEVARRKNRPLLILADSVGATAERMLLRNRAEGVVESIAVRAPMFGDTRREALGDLVCRYGGSVFAKEAFAGSAVKSLRELSEEDLGRAKTAVITAGSVTLEGDGADSPRLKDRVAQVRAEIERGDTQSGGSPSAALDYVEKRRERLKLLNPGSAKLRIGGQTDFDVKLRLPLAENGLRALRAATRSGVVAGGGTALLRAGKSIEAELQAVEGDRALGASVFLQSLDAPFRGIVSNAGFRPDELIGRVLEQESDEVGFNAATGQVSNLFQDGVVDTLAMVAEVIKVGVSVAGSTLGVGALITRGRPAPDPARFRGTAAVHEKLLREGAFDA